MLDRLYDLDLVVLYPALIILIAGAGELGAWLDRRIRGGASGESDINTLAGAALGLLALLLAFSFSLALSRYEARRLLVLEEANAIGSTANFALMLPDPAQKPILGPDLACRTTRKNFNAMFADRWSFRPGCGNRPWQSPRRPRNRCRLTVSWAR